MAKFHYNKDVYRAGAWARTLCGLKWQRVSITGANCKHCLRMFAKLQKRG